MTDIQIKVALTVDIGDAVARVVSQQGSSPPVIIDKRGLIQTLTAAIHKFAYGAQYADLDPRSLRFILPIDLFVLCRGTAIESPPYTILEVVARNCGLHVSQLEVEYPPPDRTREVCDHLNNLLLQAQRQTIEFAVERARHLDRLKQLEVANYIAGKACEILAELSAEVDDTGMEAQAIMCEWDTSGSSAGEAAARRAAASRKAGGQ